MLIKILKGKLYRAVVTDARPDYPGSIEIDSALMEAAGILPYESVLVADLDNGSRLETYAVAGQAGSGRVSILGAAARLIKRGDIIIVFSFGYYTPDEEARVKPRVVVLDENNRIKTANSGGG